MAIGILHAWCKLLCFKYRLNDKTTGGRLCRTLILCTVIGVIALATLVITHDSISTYGITSSFSILIHGQRKQVSGTFKKAYENNDGSVDVVFNIPMPGKDLMEINASDTGIAEGKASQKADGLDETTLGHPRPSRPAHRMAYPLTLQNDYIINSRRACIPGETLDYLIAVHSATAYFDRRQAMRKTYAAKHLFGKIRQSIVFFLGVTDDPVTTLKIQKEAITYGDIVQGDFFDSYHNLTHKGVLGYRWIAEYCPQARLILKLDDDLFVNPFKLINDFLPKFNNKTRQIACHLRPKGTSPILRGKGKWQVSSNEFKGLANYPFPYCNGYFVLMSSDLIRPMLQSVPLNPFFWIDDVYLFGLLPATIGNVDFVDIFQNLTLFYNAGKKCYENKGLACPYVAVAQWRKEDSTSLWHMLLDLVPESTKIAFGIFDWS